MCLALSFVIVLFYLETDINSSVINDTVLTAICNKTLKTCRYRWEPAASPNKQKTLLILVLLLAGDIEQNPGPAKQNATVWPCGICQYPVTWGHQGVACDGCSLWHHKSCLSMCSNDYKDLEGSNVVWLCCKCDSINCDNFTFRSYELNTSNSFQPLTTIDLSIDSIHSSVFSPLHTSSPKVWNELRPRRRESSAKFSSESYNSKHWDPLTDLPSKQNLRIMNINCRSVKENNSEFKAAVDYVNPDIICGTESWLKGVKPGKSPTNDAIKNSEIFPENYNVFRNDRGTLGVGVFIAVQKNISALECVDFVTSCEVEYAKITLKSKKTLYIGTFYMPHRKLPDLEQLEQSLNLLNISKPKQLILCGDFNCPDIQWETLTVPCDPNVQDKNVHQKLINLMSENNLTQVHDQPTRNGKLLDLVFTTNPSLIKSSVSIPGISDHDIVVTDADIKPIYTRQKPRKVYKWKQAN